jgi:hypothetical protein
VRGHVHGAFWLTFATVLLVSCRQPPLSSEAEQSRLHVAENRRPSPEEESCRAFVQKFYDWYWNQFADRAADPKFDLHQLHWYDDALQLKPAVLSPELVRLIGKDEAASKAAGGDIVNLDFDPFLASQDAQGKYEVQNAVVRGNVCDVTMKARGNVRPELRKSSDGWMFVNFHYKHFSEDGKTREFPDDDLIQILSR